jgi:hypothetical protein
MSDTPSIAELLATHAAAYTVKRTAADAEAALRIQATRALCDLHDANGTDRLTVTVPGIGPLAKASLAVPKPTAEVTDGAAFTEFVAAHAPEEVQDVITIHVNQGGFGAEDAVADLIALLEGMPPEVVTWSRKTDIRLSYRKVVLDPKNIVAGVLAHVTPDGELLDVPGVEVTTAAPSKFSFTGWDKDKAADLLSMLLGDPEALRRALDGVPLAIEDGNTVPGEVVAEAAGPAQEVAAEAAGAELETADAEPAPVG